MSDGFELPPGVIAMTSYGQITAETMQSYAETRVKFAEQGIKNISWPVIMGSLVDKARNEAVMGMLSNNAHQWLLFIDGDMQWHPDGVLLLLSTAYGSHKDADIVGGWCPLRGYPYLPTIDPGSGTWEPVPPGVGPVEVMRTGGAFILIKRHVFERMKAPWYGVRPAERPLDMLMEVENFALQKFDGKNPLREHEAWAKLEQCAYEEHPRDPTFPYSTVGEDSNFCDRARGLGFKIVVQTNAVANHVDRKVITPEDHLTAMKELRNKETRAKGVLV